MMDSTYKVLPLLPPPNTQALASKTFRPPPLDGSLTLPEVYDWHLENTPNHPLFVFSDDEGKEHTVLWPEAVRAAHRAGWFIRSLLGQKGNEVTESPSVVAILATTG